MPNTRSASAAAKHPPFFFHRGDRILDARLAAHRMQIPPPSLPVFFSAFLPERCLLPHLSTPRLTILRSVIYGLLGQREVGSANGFDLHKCSLHSSTNSDGSAKPRVLTLDAQFFDPLPLGSVCILSRRATAGSKYGFRPQVSRPSSSARSSPLSRPLSSSAWLAVSCQADLGSSSVFL